MPKLAVVRPNTHIPVRDLLLFDEFHVISLDKFLDRLAGQELADLNFLIEKGMVLRAPSTLGELGLSSISPATTHAESDDTAVISFEVAGTRLELLVRNLEMNPITIDLDLAAVPVPAAASRLVAAAVSETFATDSYCTFVIQDGEFSPFDNFDVKWNWQFVVSPTPALDRPSISIGRWRSPGTNLGVDLRLAWPRTTLEPEHHDQRVFSVTLEAFPVPTPDTPIEEVLNFRKDVFERQHLDRLGRWVQRILCARPYEPQRLRLDIADMVEALSAEMAVHRIAVTREPIKFLLTLPSQVIGLAATPMSPGDPLAGVMSLTCKQVRLMQAETRTEGCEVAYIAASRDRIPPANGRPSGR